METADIEAIPIIKTFDLKDEKDAYDAAEEMVRIGFYKEKKGFKVLMPRESKKTAKRIGYIVTTSVSAGLRKAGQERIYGMGHTIMTRNIMQLFLQVLRLYKN